VQEREKDLVIATFGRGFYIIDDYSPLREISAKAINNDDAILFPVKDALMFTKAGNGRYGTGAGYYEAKNPDFGAVFTYYLKEVPTTLKADRIKKEKKLFKDGLPIPQPTKEILDAEKNEPETYLVFTIKDEAGSIVKNIYKKPAAGINRLNWDMRYKSTTPVRLKNDKFNPLKGGNTSLRALPGKYSVTMLMYNNGELKEIAEPVNFNAVVLNNTTLPDVSREESMVFYKNVAELWRVMSASVELRNEMAEKIAYIKQGLQSVTNATPELKNKIDFIDIELQNIAFELNGTPAKASAEEVPPANVSLNSRLNSIIYTSWQSTSAPTSTQKMNYEVLIKEFPIVLKQLTIINENIKEIENELDALKVPHTPGRVPKF